MQQASTEAKSTVIRTNPETAKQQLAETKKEMAKYLKIYERIKAENPGIEPEPVPEELEEPPEDPREKYYTPDQLQIALCGEALTTLATTLPDSLIRYRVVQARNMLYYLGEMSEFIPRPAAPAPQPAPTVEKAPAEPDEFLLDEDRLVDAKDAFSPDTNKELDIISAKLKDMDEQTIMKKQEPVKKEAGIRGLIQKLSMKKPAEAEVSAEHQTISLG
jgi:hypothetical protein